MNIMASLFMRSRVKVTQRKKIQNPAGSGKFSVYGSKVRATPLGETNRGGKRYKENLVLMGRGAHGRKKGGLS